MGANAASGASELALNTKTLPEIAQNRKIQVTAYARDQVTCGWVHIGSGAFHRAHQAVACEVLLRDHFDASRTWGLEGVNLLPGDERLCSAMAAQDGLYSLLERDAAGETLRVIGSVGKVWFGPRDMAGVVARMSSEQVRLITLTVTEGGYYIDRASGKFLADHPDIVHDRNNPQQPKTALGLLRLVLSERLKNGVGLPTVLSCDNVKENGEVLKSSLKAFCTVADPDLVASLDQVAFPNSMVDRITPRTTDKDRAHIRESYGVDDQAPVVSETFWQWVIEDHFPAGRPAFEKVPGVIFTKDVRPYEDMKLRLLNAGHSQCGYLGHLAGYTLIDQVASDEMFRSLLSKFWNEEVIPNLPPVPGINFGDYCASLTARFSNPNLGDQTLRICLDGSAKIPTFVLPSVRDGLKRGTPTRLGALCVAAWIRFCKGDGEKGEAIPIEDPMAETLRKLGAAVAADPQHSSKPFMVALPEIFGDLSNNAEFVGQVDGWVKSLFAQGARATLKMAVNG